MRARLWNMPVVVAALVTGTVGGLGAAVAAPSGLAGTGGVATQVSANRPGSLPSVPGAVRFAASTNVALAAARAAAAQAAAAQSGRQQARSRTGGPQGGPAAVIRRGATAAAPRVTDAVTSDSKRGLAAPAMSQAMLTANQLRQAAAARALAAATPPAAKDLAATQRAQIRNYFCGPATVTEMLAQMGVTLHQPGSARALGTDPSGTAWSTGHGYPVPRVLNAHQSRHSYVATGLPWSPTNRQIATFRTDLVTDIAAGAPIAGNAYEVPGGPHLVGHPPGQTILHWFDIRGYSRGGAFTDYEDSVHGASSIGWSAAVPAYSTLPTATVVIILGARGYVW